MPKRSNLFQKVVRVLHETVAGEANVEESALLVDTDTDEEREVDVLIRTTVASHQVLIGVKATASGRKADVPWVEGQLQKHSTLPTNKLVLVSEAGFSGPARKKAEANDAVTLAPADVPDDFEDSQIVNKLGSIYPKVVSLDLLEVLVTCKAPEGEQEEDFAPPVGVRVFDESGEPYGTLQEVVASSFDQHFIQVSEEIDLANVVDDFEKEMTLDLGGPWSVERRHGETNENATLCLNPRADGSSLGLWPIQHMRIKGKMRVEVGEIPLSHKRLSGLSNGFSFGEGKVGDSHATFVVNETQGGAKGWMILETKDGPIEGELRPPSAPNDSTGSSAGRT